MKIKSFLKVGAIVTSSMLIIKGIDASIAKEIVETIRIGNVFAANTLQLVSKNNIILTKSMIGKNIKKIRDKSIEKTRFISDKYINRI